MAATATDIADQHFSHFSTCSPACYPPYVDFRPFLTGEPLFRFSDIIVPPLCRGLYIYVCVAHPCSCTSLLPPLLRAYYPSIRYTDGAFSSQPSIVVPCDHDWHLDIVVLMCRSLSPCSVSLVKSTLEKRVSMTKNCIELRLSRLPLFSG